MTERKIERVELSKKKGWTHFKATLRRALARNRRDAAIIAATALAGLAVTAWILTNQTQFKTPTWWPGSADPYEFVAEFEDASGLLPGTAQPVAVSGVEVGVVKDVELNGQTAGVTVEIRDEDLEVYNDATLLVRPRTALKDMFVALDPGTSAAGELDDGGTIPITQTQPTVDLQDILANLDTDTRGYLRLLLNAGAEGFGASEAANSEGEPGTSSVEALSSTMSQFKPFTRDARLVTEELGKRRQNLKRVVTGLSEVMTSTAAVNTDISALIDGANRTFEATGSQDAQLAAALDELPGTLDELNTALIGTEELSRQLRISTGNLRGVARALPGAEKSLIEWAPATRPVFKNQLRPFARQVKPIVIKIKPLASELAAAAPGLRTGFDVLEGFFQALSHNPAGAEEGYLFWGAWLSHIVPSVLSIQDAHGAALRGLPMLTCPQLDALNTVEAANPILGSITKLANLPDFQVFC